MKEDGNWIPAFVEVGMREALYEIQLWVESGSHLMLRSAVWEDSRTREMSSVEKEVSHG